VSQRAKRAIFLTLAAAAALLGGGCLPPTRVEFIEKMASENRKIARTAYDFRQSFNALSSGSSVNPSDVRTAYNAMAAAVKEVKADMQYQMLPPSSNSAKDFLTAYKEYLDAQQDMVDNEMLQIVQEVELPTDADGNPTPADRWAIINDKLNSVQQKDRDALSKVTSAQQTYCGEHNYQSFGLEAYIANEKSGK
jgi:hypothetical protein